MKLSKERKPSCRLSAKIFAIMRHKIKLCPSIREYIRKNSVNGYFLFKSVYKQQITKRIALYVWTCVSICTYCIQYSMHEKFYERYCIDKYLLYVSVSGFFSQIRDLLVSIILIAVDVLIRFIRSYGNSH